MIRMPRLTGKDIVAALKRAGFAEIRRRGSHCYLQHPDGRHTTVPIHSGETIGPGLMGKILHDCEMTKDDLVALL